MEQEPPKIGKRSTRRYITIGIEHPSGWLTPLLIVPRNTSKYNPKEEDKKHAEVNEKVTPEKEQV